MNETRPILCGKCHVPIKGGIERDGDAWGICPNCGQEDRMDEIVREVSKYHVDKMVDGMFSGIRSSSSMTIKSPPERQYRWIRSD